MASTELADAGIAYLRAGLSILALDGKAPNGALHRHGLKDPYTGTGNVGNWVQACTHPDTTGVGILLTGNLLVVDIDGEEGAVSLQKLIGPGVPVTPVTKTARGLHLWFLSAYRAKSMKLGPKLDIKGLGGYVAAPPSVHPGDEEAGIEPGRVYEWLDPIINDHGLVWADWLPEPIERLVAGKQQVFRLAPGTGGGSIEALARHLRTKGEGTRNDTLFWAAATARDDGIPFPDAAPVLLAAATDVGLGRPEAMRTIESAYGGGSR